MDPLTPDPLSHTARERGCRVSGGGEGCSISREDVGGRLPRLRRGRATHASPLRGGRRMADGPRSRADGPPVPRWPPLSL